MSKKNKAKTQQVSGLPQGKKDEQKAQTSPAAFSSSTPASPPAATIADPEAATDRAAAVYPGANGHALPEGLTVPGPGTASPEGNGEPMAVGDPRGALMPYMCGYSEGPVSRRTGFPCRGKAMANGRCRFCGGNAKRGAAHPRWKGGAYSKYMPRDVAGRYRDAMTDPDLLSARDEIALVQLRIQDLMGKLQEGGTADLWQSLRQEFADVRAAISAGDAGALDRTLSALGQIIDKGSATEDVWGEMYEAIEAKTKVSEREWRRLRDLRQFMTVQQSMDLVTYLVDCVTRHVADRDVLGLITQDMGKVLASPAGRLPQPPAN